MPTSTTIESTRVELTDRDNQEDLPTVRQHPASGLAARANGGAEEKLTDCPFCGGRICACEIQDSAGLRRFSLCCDVAMEFVDHYDIFQGLPEHLQQVAIQGKKDEYAKMEQKSRDNARRFREAVDHWNAKYGHLTKRTQDGVPYDKETADLIPSYDV